MIEHDLFIVVCDAQRAHVYQNIGGTKNPALEFVIGFEQKNPPTSQQGTDKPGTAFGSASGPRSHLQETDYHQQQQKAFAKEILDALSELKSERKISKLVWIAPPRMLALLRADMPETLGSITLAEIDKDLTKHPAPAIIELLDTYLSRREE